MTYQHFKFCCPRLTLRARPRSNLNTSKDSQPMISFKMVSHCIPSRSNNKPVISTFKFGCPHLTLKEGPKVKSDQIRIFQVHDFLYVGFTLQTSKTNNKRVVGKSFINIADIYCFGTGLPIYRSKHVFHYRHFK